MVDIEGMVPVRDLSQTGFDDALDLMELASDAERFLLHHTGCRHLEAIYFDRGFKAVAVFYAITEVQINLENNFWIVVGDMPPMCFVGSRYENGAKVLLEYSVQWLRWAEAARTNAITDGMAVPRTAGTFEVLKPTSKLIEAIEIRANFIKDKVVPTWPEDL